jgi:hypothetical protein
MSTTTRVGFTSSIGIKGSMILLQALIGLALYIVNNLLLRFSMDMEKGERLKSISMYSYQCSYHIEIVDLDVFQ